MRLILPFTSIRLYLKSVQVEKDKLIIRGGTDSVEAKIHYDYNDLLQTFRLLLQPAVLWFLISQTVKKILGKLKIVRGT